MKSEVKVIISLILIAILPFVQADSNVDGVNIEYTTVLIPNIVVKSASLIRWFIYLIIIGSTLFTLTTAMKHVVLLTLTFGGFYFIQLCYSAFDGIDIYRYLGLTLISISLASYVGSSKIISKIKEIQIIICVELILALLLNYKLIISGLRFTGFANNSNLFGAICCFWLAIMFVKSSLNNIIRYLAIMILMFSIVMTGSRNAFIVAIIISIVHLFYKNKTYVIYLIPTLLVFLFTFNLRVLEISSAASDSGRMLFWKSAFFHIQQNFLWGNGMDANMRLVGTGNMHNCYIRYLLNMGFVFTVMSFLLLSAFFIFWYRNRKYIPKSIFIFPFCFALMNIGEDFYVGVGSAFWGVFVFTIGLGFAFIKTNKI